MKLYIETDIEGIAGFSFGVDKMPDEQKEAYRARINRLLTHEVNAAIEGAFSGGADEVLVHDGHSTGYNIIIEELHPEARICQGISAYAPNWQPGLDKSIDAVIGIGGHVRKGTNGLTPHTLFTVNNSIQLGEFEMTAALAGWLDIPFIYASGDTELEKQLKTIIPDIEYTPVKIPLYTCYANSITPVKARELIKKGVKKAVGNYKKNRPFKIPAEPPFAVNILGSDYQDPNAIGRSSDFWEAVMQSLETIFYYDCSRKNPWPGTPRGPVYNKHQLISGNLKK